MKYILILLIMGIWALPTYAQLSNPLPGIYAPAPISFFRIALIPPMSFKSLDVAQATCDQLKTIDADEKYFLFKVVEQPDHTYSVWMLLRIIFFEKKDAELALEYLKNDPRYDTTKFKAEVVMDHD